MSNLPQNPDFQKWADNYCQEIVNATFRLFAAQARNRGGGNTARFLAMLFLAKFVGSIVLSVLNEKPSTTSEEENYKHSVKTFSDIKLKIQEAVAAGFTGAMTVFTGHQVEYYSQIKTVPEAANKKPA